MTSMFPEIDQTAIRVRWAPLIVEPIPLAPERFVAAIVATTSTGEFACHRQLDRRRLKELVGEGAESLAAVIDTSSASLSRHLAQSNDMGDWKSPFEGVYLGSDSLNYVRRFSDIFAIAPPLCSVFGKQIVLLGRDDLVSKEPWDVPVVEFIRKMSPNLSNSLNAQLNLSSTQHTVAFTYFGTKLAANVVVLNAQRMAMSLREARAHLWNLSLLADTPNLLFKPDRLELLTGVQRDGQKVRDAIEELTFEASRRDVFVSRVESSEDAARRIIAMAA